MGWLFMRRFVSIHAPWEGCDHTQLPDSVTLPSFQFTHPGKGATRPRDHRRVTNQVSIHAPWEGCDSDAEVVLKECRVSIHAPWEGCDRGTPRQATRDGPVSIHAPWEGCDGIDHIISNLDSLSFNSRTLGRVRLHKLNRSVVIIGVSIHAPWEGCDRWDSKTRSTKGRFNSRTLGRVRLVGWLVVVAYDDVSIHAPWEGCDR